MRRHPSRSHRGQRGVVIIWMALFLLVMLAFIGLGIDMAKLMAARVQLQKAADAAALAGASAFRDGSSGAATAEAKARAYETAAYNKAFEIGVTPVLVDTTQDVIVDLDSMWVTVTARRDPTMGTPVVTHFLRVIGLPNLGMRATATAKAEGGCTIVPLAIQAPPGQTFQPGCATQYIIKFGPPDGENGGYGPLDLTDCPGNPCEGGGASKFGCEMRIGAPCSCVELGECVPSEQGNMSGPTKAAIEYRFSIDTDKRIDICYSEPPDPYQGNGARVVIAPLTGPKEGSGGGCYTTYALGKFFIKRVPGSGNLNYITAEFIEYVDPEGLGRNSFTVRLIR